MKGKFYANELKWGTPDVLNSQCLLFYSGSLLASDSSPERQPLCPIVYSHLCSYN